MKVKLKRVYEPHAATDGYRILVDRLWPRGIKKDSIDKWLKDVAPSTELRKWFDHDPQKWAEFIALYKAELKDSEAFAMLSADIKAHKTITLLYAAKDEKHNNAVALEHFLKGGNK